MKKVFHPSSLKVIRPSEKPRRDGFVGVRERNGQTEFCLPKGFEEYPEEEVTNIFFDLYRTFDVYQKLIERSHRETEELQDSGLQTERGISYLTESDETVTLYSKLPFFERLAEEYNLPRIYSIISSRSKTEEVDYSKIHRYLDKAVFLEDHTPYVNEMRLSSRRVSKSTTKIVEIYCYVYVEVFEKVRGIGGISQGIVDTANRFKKDNLPPESNLFEDKHTHHRTIKQIKSIFEKLDRSRKYKGVNYVDFRDSIESFLYGSISPQEGGIYWGSKEFFRVWEDMCSYYIYKNEKDREAEFIDSTRLSNNRVHGGRDVYKSDNFGVSLYFSTGEGKRYIRPDYVSTKRARSPSEKRQEILDFETPTPASIKVKGERDSELSIRCINRIKKKLKFSNARMFEKWSVKLEGVKPNAIGNAKDIAEGVISSEASDSAWESHAIIYDIKYKSRRSYQAKNDYPLSKAEVRKQLLYEYAIDKSSDIENLSSVFLVPLYCKEKSLLKNVENRKPFLIDNGIKVKTISFKDVQKEYNNIKYGK